jgi:cytochrome oxidase complex assembly protein 1
MDQPRERSWWGRNWKWVVPLGCLTPFLLVGGCVATFAILIFASLKNSEAYNKSFEAVCASKEVQSELGSPIRPAFLVSGGIYVNTLGGHAQVSYDVSGPKGAATVYVIADKKDGEWTFRSIKVLPKDSGRKIDVRLNDEVDSAARFQSPRACRRVC